MLLLHSFATTLVLSIWTATAATAINIAERMTSGSPVASPEDYPFVASFRILDTLSPCANGTFGTAAILSDRHLITSSFCVSSGNTQKASNGIVGVQAGSLSPVTSTERKLSKLFWPAGGGSRFTPGNYNNMFAGMLIDPPFQLGKTIKPIKISTIPVKDQEELTIVGWGSDGTTRNWRDKLATTTVRVVNNAECRTAWNSFAPNISWIDQSKGEHFCTSGGMPCTGDLGSLIIRKEKNGYSLVGMGVPRIIQSGQRSTACTDDNQYSYWMKLAAFTVELTDWLGQGVNAISTDDTDDTDGATPSEPSAPPASVTTQPSSLPRPPVDTGSPTSNTNEIIQLPIGMIVGIVFGVMAALALTVGAIMHFRHGQPTAVDSDESSNRLSFVSTGDPVDVYVPDSTNGHIDPLATFYQNMTPVQPLYPVYISPDMLYHLNTTIYDPVYAAAAAVAMPMDGQVAIMSCASPTSGYSEYVYSPQQSAADGMQSQTLLHREQHMHASAAQGSVHMNEEDLAIQWQSPNVAATNASSSATVAAKNIYP